MLHCVSSESWPSSSTRLWMHAAQHKFEAVTEDVGLEINTNNLGQAVGWGDIDNDGDLDLAYSYSNPADFKLYRNEDGFYTDITTASGLSGIAAWTSYGQR